ncbi:MAG: polymer-forming cytoskeletal protein [Chthoniobacteraceae bacterium]
MSKYLAGRKTREITCFDCGAVQTVSSSSSSSLCPQCSAYIDLSDFKINAAFSRLIQTQGTVVLGAKADVTSSKVACRQALIKGKLRGNLLCTDSATIKYKGKISGAVEARKLIIARGANVEFVRPVKAKFVEIFGTVSANLHVDGIVKIVKRGRLEGTVEARGIVVEKGGIFLGELSIGSRGLVQPELAPAATDEPESPLIDGKPEKPKDLPPAQPGGKPKKAGQQNLDLDF